MATAAVRAAEPVAAPSPVRSRTPRALAWGPLFIGVAIQAVLLFANIGLLTIWTDEAFTVDTVTRPAGDILRIVRNDIHPPLYFLIARAWIRLPLAAEILDRIRLLSACWTLLATIALDRLWLARLKSAARYVALGFWCLSPAVLLYGRMARSYSMQAALAIVAITLAWRFVQKPGPVRMSLSAVAIALLFYTHYAPAFAIAAAFSVVLLARWRGGMMPPALFAGWIATAVALCAPWMLQLGEALSRWSAGYASARYALTGNWATEHALKIAYGAVSLAIGESFPAWAVCAAAAVVLAAGAAVRGAVRSHKELLWAFGVATVFGYLGVVHWVSYPFIPARMLWLLPAVAVAVGLGVAGLKRKWGLAIIAIVLCADGASIVSYYSRSNFLNKGYAVPLREMAAVVNAGSGPAESLVLMDGYNTDYSVLQRYLPAGVPQIVLNGSGEVDQAAALLKTGSVRRVWVIANAHDISPGRATSRIRSQACDGATARRRYGYLPFEWWERRAMELIRVSDPPSYFYEVVECSR